MKPMKTLFNICYANHGKLLLYRHVSVYPSTTPKEIIPIDNEATVGNPLKPSSVLDRCEEDVSDYSPYLAPSFNLAAYINKSPSLQKLVELGVDLNKIEKTKGAAAFILKLKFETDMVKHIQFLCDIGVPADNLGKYITKVPYIFGENIEDLKVRINYLLSKKFAKNCIARIVTNNPKWLMFRTQHIDRRLGYFQQSFKLEGDEVRYVTTKMPKLITYDLNHIEETKFAVREEMGLTFKESKDLVIQKPKVYTIRHKALVSRFSYLHNIMELPHSLILKQPGGLLCREEKLKQRHEFLQYIGKAQYDPTLPSYVSLENLVRGDDTQFCKNVAGTSVATFNQFLKSL